MHMCIWALVQRHTFFEDPEKELLFLNVWFFCLQCGGEQPFFACTLGVPLGRTEAVSRRVCPTTGHTYATFYHADVNPTVPW